MAWFALMAGIIINPRARIFHGHCWGYTSEVKKTFGNPQPGDVITMKDFKDRPLGSTPYLPLSDPFNGALKRPTSKANS